MHRREPFATRRLGKIDNKIDETGE